MDETKTTEVTSVPNQSRVMYAYTKPKQRLMFTKVVIADKPDKLGAIVPVPGGAISAAKLKVVSKEETVETITEKRRGTVAMQYKNGQFVYGIAICSPSDTYNREEGMKLARQRMEEGFASIPEESLTGLFSAFEKEKSMTLGEQQKVKIVLYRVLDKLASSINTGKYERKLEAHRKWLESKRVATELVAKTTNE